MSNFQSTVSLQLGFGVPGEVLYDGPQRIDPLTVYSNGAGNTVGYAFTKNSQTNVATLGGVLGTAASSFTGVIAAGVMTVSGGITGTNIQVGDIISGTNINAGTYVASFGTGTGGNGTYNVVGTTSAASTTVTVAAQGGPGVVFAGILVNPKNYANIGTSAGTLVPAMNIPDYSIGEFMTTGFVVVNLPATSNIGDQVQYNNTTGAISTVAPGGSVTSGCTFIPNAKVVRFSTLAAGLGIIQL